MKHLIARMRKPGWLGLWIAFSVVLAACGPSAAAVSIPSASATAVLSATSTLAATPAAPTASPEASIPNTGSAVLQAVDLPGFGQTLVTADGRTLYSNSVDSAQQIVCADSSCTNFWPPYIVDAQPAAVEGIPGTLGTVTRPDGTLQLTYNQKPLYTFYLDKAPGDAKGNGFVDLGGTWSVASLASAPAAPAVNSPVPAPTSGSAGYGY